MALVVAQLQTAFQSFIANPSTTIADASQKWAQAIYSYSSAAQALDATPAAALPAKLAPLQASFLASMGSNSFLTDLPTNLTTFWTGVPFVGANNGPVSVIGGAAALAATISTMMVTNVQASPGASALDNLATAIDVFTKAVVVALVNPAGVVIPTPLL